MRFKHSFHVFVDNFPVIYKHLLYRLVITVITALLSFAVIYPFVKELTGSQAFIDLIDGLKAFFNSLIEGRAEELGDVTQKIKDSFAEILDSISHNRGIIALGMIGLVLVHLIDKFFTGLGNYAMGAIVNDKMAMGAKSPYLITLVRNLKEASLFSIIYSPLSIVYDLVCYVGLFLIVFKLFWFIPLLLKVFLYSTLMVAAISVKMVFTCDWLPALIRGKMRTGQAFLYTFKRKGKDSFNVLANFVLLIIIIYAVNVGAVVCTLGTAALITIPASYLVLISFEFVNYYGRENMRYFIDKNTIIKPAKGRNLTREEFFRGESE